MQISLKKKLTTSISVTNSGSNLKKNLDNYKEPFRIH